MKISTSNAFLANLLCWSIVSPLAGAQHQQATQRRRRQQRQLIVGGQNAIQGRYPYFVSLDYRNGVVLSGALIAPDFVLTAGHCLENDIERMTVRVGTYSLSHDNVTTHDVDIVHVVEPILHTGFERLQMDSFSHDFLLFHLNHTSSFPVVRINRDPAVPVPLEDTVTMMGLGWMTLAFQSPADTLQVANLTTISNQECSLSKDPARVSLSYAGLIDGTMLCTVSSPNNTRDGCAWDSGAPLILPGLDGDPANDVLVGMGTYSFSTHGVLVLASHTAVYTVQQDHGEWGVLIISFQVRSLHG